MSKNIKVAFAIVLLGVACKPNNAYDIYYPTKKINSNDGIEELRKKFVDLGEADNPWHDGRRFYSLKEVLSLEKSYANLFLTYRRAYMREFSCHFYGDSIPIAMIKYYDSCYHTKSDYTAKEFHYGRSNEDMKDTLVLSVRKDITPHGLGYYYFALKEK